MYYHVLYDIGRRGDFFYVVFIYLVISVFIWFYSPPMTNQKLYIYSFQTPSLGSFFLPVLMTLTLAPKTKKYHSFFFMQRIFEKVFSLKYQGLFLIYHSFFFISGKMQYAYNIILSLYSFFISFYIERVMRK